MSTKSHEVIFSNQGRTTLWRSYNSRALKATSPRRWSRPPSRRRQFSKNMAPNIFACPGSTQEYEPHSEFDVLRLQVAPALDLRLVAVLGEALKVFRSVLAGGIALSGEFLADERVYGHRRVTRIARRWNVSRRARTLGI